MPDLFNREIFGWSIKQRMTAEIVTNALMMVWFRSVRVHRNVKGGIVRYGPIARCRRLAGLRAISTKGVPGRDDHYRSASGANVPSRLARNLRHQPASSSLS